MDLIKARFENIMDIISINPDLKKCSKLFKKDNTENSFFCYNAQLSETSYNAKVSIFNKEEMTITGNYSTYFSQSNLLKEFLKENIEFFYFIVRDGKSETINLISIDKYNMKLVELKDKIFLLSLKEKINKNEVLKCFSIEEIKIIFNHFESKDIINQFFEEKEMEMLIANF